MFSGAALTAPNQIEPDLRSFCALTCAASQRMDVPFSILLTEADILNEVVCPLHHRTSAGKPWCSRLSRGVCLGCVQSVLISAVWEAAVEVRKHASFPAWYDGRKPFDVLHVYAHPLYRDPSHPAPGTVPEARERPVLLSELQEVRLRDAWSKPMACRRNALVLTLTHTPRQTRDARTRAKRARILNNAPFMIMMECQAKTEIHVAQFFATPLGAGPKQHKLYRVCKVCSWAYRRQPCILNLVGAAAVAVQVDCGHNVSQADNLWNIDSAVDVLSELLEDVECVACVRPVCARRRAASYEPTACCQQRRGCGWSRGSGAGARRSACAPRLHVK